MFTATRIESTIRPEKFESLNNGIWYYNYDIKSRIVQVQEHTNESEKLVEQTLYDFVLVRIAGKPTYEECVRAVIKHYIDTDKELDLINSYNSYLLGIESKRDLYDEYLQMVKEIKENVGRDFLIQPEARITYLEPRLSDIAKFMTMAINTVSLTDQQALSVKSLYPHWADFIGQTVQKDIKLLYNLKLFKVVLEHLVQGHFPPSIHTASLYTEIVEENRGTIDDPIPYPLDGNMTIYRNKYYIEEGIIYKCIRDSGLPLYARLSALIGNYVEKVEKLS